MFSISGELYRDLFIVCVFCSRCLLLRSLTSIYFSHTDVVVGLRLTSSMYVLVLLLSTVLMFNDTTLLSFS